MSKLKAFKRNIPKSDSREVSEKSVFLHEPYSALKPGRNPGYTRRAFGQCLANRRKIELLVKSLNRGKSL